MLIYICLIFLVIHLTVKSKLEVRGIEPRASRMRSERSTIWATPPILVSIIYKLKSKCLISKNKTWPLARIPTSFRFVCFTPQCHLTHHSVSNGPSMPHINIVIYCKSNQFSSLIYFISRQKLIVKHPHRQAVLKNFLPKRLFGKKRVSFWGIILIWSHLLSTLFVGIWNVMKSPFLLHISLLLLFFFSINNGSSTSGNVGSFCSVSSLISSPFLICWPCLLLQSPVLCSVFFPHHVVMFTSICLRCWFKLLLTLLLFSFWVLNEDLTDWRRH